MSNNKYFIKMGGLNEFALSPNVDDTSADLTLPKSLDNPLNNPQDVKVSTPNIIGMAVKGSATSTTVKGQVPPKSALAGYEPVDNEKNNSEIVDKTPDNSELNDPSQLKNDEPSTDDEGDEHPHQIQSGEVNREHELETSPNTEMPSQDGVVDIEVDENETPEHEIKPELNENLNKHLTDDSGNYPSSAWPGMYPLYYITKDGGCLCPECANKNKNLTRDIHDPQWYIVASEANYENEDLVCDNCNKKIESAYGEPNTSTGETDVATMADREANAGHDMDESIYKFKNDRLKIGNKVKISGGSGVDSGKVVTIVDKSNIVTTGFGTPSNVKGAYKPVDWSKEVAIQYDDGSFGTMFKNRLVPINNETGATNTSSITPKVNTDKIDKLQSLHETLSKKSFLSMKEVMLLNEARKIINNAKR
jgi:hypothetical protein